MKYYLIGDIGVWKNIKKLRKEAGMTQESVIAKLQLMGLNTSRSTIGMIETGRRNVPVSMLVGLKIIFNCDYADFFEGLEEKLAAGIIDDATG